MAASAQLVCNTWYSLDTLNISPPPLISTTLHAGEGEIRDPYAIVVPPALEMIMMMIIMWLALAVVVTTEVQEVPVASAGGCPMMMVKAQIMVKQKGMMTIMPMCLW